MAERDVAGGADGGGERKTDQMRAKRISAVGHRLDGDHATLVRAGDPPRQSLAVADGFIGAEPGSRFLRRRLSCLCCIDLGFFLPLRLGYLGGQARQDAAEAHRHEPGSKLRPVGRAGHELIDRQRKRHVVMQGDELARQPRLVRALDQDVAALARLHRRGGGEHRFQIAEFVDQLGGSFGADAGNAGHVVRAVADQRLHVAHLLRRNAKLLHHLGRADGFLLDGVQHLHAGADQLHQVLVGGHDGDLPALFLGGARVRGDQVIRFPVRQFNRGHAECVGGFAHERELRDQLVRRGRAVGLVVLIEPVAERHPPRVEHHRDMRSHLLPQQFGQHVGEAEHGIHGHAVFPRHGRQRVEGAEDEARSVDQDQMKRPILGFGCGGNGGLNVRWRGRLLHSG